METDRLVHYRFQKKRGGSLSVCGACVFHRWRSKSLPVNPLWVPLLERASFSYAGIGGSAKPIVSISLLPNPSDLETFAVRGGTIALGALFSAMTESYRDAKGTVRNQCACGSPLCQQVMTGKDDNPPFPARQGKSNFTLGSRGGWDDSGSELNLVPIG